MRVKPNQTVLRGRVQAIHPEEDGWGANVDLLVVENETPSDEADFLRPAPGSVIQAFVAEPKKLKVGGLFRVHASLLAGPFGGRTVVESFRRIRESANHNHKGL
ncbi:MAG: hypothetical protein ACT4QE_01620 [Anaerolineales bacterium]